MPIWGDFVKFTIFIIFLLQIFPAYSQPYSETNRLFAGYKEIIDSEGNSYIATTSSYFSYRRPPKFDQRQGVNKSSYSSKRPGNFYRYIDGYNNDLCNIILEELNNGFNVFDQNVATNMSSGADLLLDTGLNIKFERLPRILSGYGKPIRHPQIDYSILDLNNNGTLETVYIWTWTGPHIQHRIFYDDGVVDDHLALAEKEPYSIDKSFILDRANLDISAALYPEFREEYQSRVIGEGELVVRNNPYHYYNGFYHAPISFNGKTYLLSTSAITRNWVINTFLIELNEGKELKIACQFTSNYLILDKDKFEAL